MRRHLLPLFGGLVLLTALLPARTAAVDLADCELLRSNPPAYIDSGRTMVPFRVLFEWMGARVDYKEGVITATKGNQTMVLRAGQASAKVNGRTVRLETAPVIQSGTTFVPLRFASENLGADVSWLAESNTVIIKDGERCGAVVVRK